MNERKLDHRSRINTGAHVLLPFKVARLLCDPLQSRYFDRHHRPSTTAHAIYTRRMVARIRKRHHRGDLRPLAYRDCADHTFGRSLPALGCDARSA